MSYLSRALEHGFADTNEITDKAIQLARIREQRSANLIAYLNYMDNQFKSLKDQPMSFEELLNNPISQIIEKINDELLTELELIKPWTIFDIDKIAAPLHEVVMNISPELEAENKADDARRYEVCAILKALGHKVPEEYDWEKYV